MQGSVQQSALKQDSLITGCKKTSAQNNDFQEISVQNQGGFQAKFIALTAALLAAGIVSGCASTPNKSGGPKASSYKTNKAAKSRAGGQQALLDSNSIDSLESLLSATDMSAVEDDRLSVLRYGDVWRRMRDGFKMDLEVQNNRISAQRSWFSSRQPYINRLSARASRYLYYTVTEAERRGIPTEIALLPVIESSYDPAATSSAAAAGMWQFIPSTGTIYGLRQNSIYDGRRDVVESTRAAYEFLTSLYNQFGSWELALASYNAGPGRIQKAINSNRAAGLPTDYWSLRLPTETMNYVPRFLAVAQIIRNPDQYGVSLPSIANRPHFRQVQLPGVVDLTMAASIAGLNYQELYELNPGFRTSYTDPMGPNRLLIPASLSTQVDQRLRGMPTLAQTNPSLMATLGPVGGAVILSQGGNTGSATSYSTQQAAALMSAGTVNRNNTSSIISRSSSLSTPPVMAAKTTITTTLSNGQKSVRTPAPVVLAPPVIAAVRQPTPLSANSLAAFANQAIVPSSPRIPVAVTPAANIKAAAGEPALSNAELRGLTVAADKTTSTIIASKVNSGLVEIQPSAEEKAKIVAELQALAPKGTQVVDPLDGKIKLTAIQTSQSVADAKGQELQINYEKPILATQKTSNSAKNVTTNSTNNTASSNASSSASTAKSVTNTPNIVNATQKPQGERSVHVVQSGETLASIANRYAVSWRDVANWNQIDPSKALYVGTSLYLYNAKKPQPTRPTSYTVQSGDTLTGVADKFGLSNQQLADMNDLSPTSNLLRGARLSLVDNASSNNSSNDKSNDKQSDKSAAKSSDKSSSKASTKIDTISYKVRTGESVGLLANRYNISTDELASYNKFSSNSTLYIGQSIKVPATTPENADDKSSSNTRDSKPASKSEPKIETISYTVKSGDTLSGIATRFATDNDQLAKLNKISASSMVIIGQKLDVPDTDTAKPKQPERPTSYTVQSGDTLIGVATKFDLSAQQLADLNDLKANSNLMRGATLVLVDSSSKAKSDKKADGKLDSKSAKEDADNQASSTKSKRSGDTSSYTVKRGESLNSIAAKYDIDPAELAKLNQISAKSMVQTGQSLNVPKLTVKYTVKRGDTLIGLASKYDIPVSDLAKMNQMSATSDVRIGEVLVVPNNAQ